LQSYSASNSYVRPDTLDFVASVRLPDDIEAWPGVGSVIAAKLKADGVPDFIHLLAKFVKTHERNDQHMYQYLKSKGIDG
jgi:predicted flap endonuclease-1-like 5' DNA nuclease